MRTYDKLIATIFARRAMENLRPFPGVCLAENASVRASVTPQETG
jgi:hypothetical protein